MSSVVKKAEEFATAAHASIDQRRKYTNQPYIVHPKAVAATVASVNHDEPMIAAAWLHDVVEDTPVTIETIADEFGAEIAGLVADLTDVATASDGNRQQRAAINRQHSVQSDLRAKTVKLADLIDNLSDIATADPGFAPLYLSEKELLLEVLTDGDPALFQRVKEIIRASRELLANRS